MNLRSIRRRELLLITGSAAALTAFKLPTFPLPSMVRLRTQGKGFELDIRMTELQFNKLVFKLGGTQETIDRLKGK